MKWVEVVSLYSCNSRCAFCPSWRVPEGRRMTAAQVLGALQGYRREGADRVDFGGGEPTLREDTPALVRGAHELGYREIGLITNGWRLADEGYLDACVKAGLTEVTFSVWGFDAESYDRLSRTVGGYALLNTAIRNVTRRRLRTIANVMCSSVTESLLDRVIEGVAPLGISEFVIHVVSTYGMERDETAKRMVPDLVSAGRSFEAAAAAADKRGGTKLWTTHLPPCVLGAARDRYVHCRDLDMVILTSAGGFPLEKTPGEGGVAIEPCYSCAWRDRCNGVRPEDVRKGVGPKLKPITEPRP